MAGNCNEPYYVKSYKRFLANFANTENANDPLPVSLSSFNNMTEREITGEIIDVTLKYLNDLQCPTHLQAHIVHQVLQEVKHTRKKQPENYGLKHQDGLYRPQLVDAVKSTANKVCTHYLDDNKIVSLPPPPSTPFPEVVAEGIRNCRKRMEDRHVVIHDLNTIFNIRDDSVANYYAVFDGHAGEDAAVYCSTHLHQYLVESVHYPTNPERALRDAFLTTDEKFTERSTQKKNSGTTAVSVLIHRKKLYCAWVGDSSAIIVRRGAVIEIVNPHRPTREDEKQRIEKMGGGVWYAMGTKRVNGVLSVSRAIGDVRFKPFISAEPEVRTVPLDGTEDFVLIGTDGFWDHVGSSELIASCVYQEICQQPYSLKRVHKSILDRARNGGSEDNITAILVLLTPASEIAARITTTTTTTTSPIGYQTLGYKHTDKDHVNKMDLTNSLLSNENGQHEPTNGSAFLKHLQLQQQQQQQHQHQLLPRDVEEEDEEEDGDQQENGAEERMNDNHRIMYQGSSNGKHENGDADYDYSDLGPETDVDAIDDMLPSASPVKNLNYDMYNRGGQADEDEEDSSREDSSRDEGDDSSRNGGDDSSRDGDEERTEKHGLPVIGTNEQQDRDVLMDHEVPVDQVVDDGLVLEQAEAVERLVLDRENEEDRKGQRVVQDDDEDEEEEDTEDEVDEKDEMVAVEKRMKPHDQLQASGALDLLGEEEDSSERKPTMDQGIGEKEEKEDVGAVDDAHVDEQVDAVRSDVVVEDAAQVENHQESQPSPRATKPLQHALIPEADNVADSEDSEDEWNYYPNKEKDSTAAVDQPREVKGKEVEEEEDEQQKHSGKESPVEEDDNDPVVQSPELVQDIKCESPKVEEQQDSPELIDTEISAEGRRKPVETAEERETFEERTRTTSLKQGDMDFQLNPNAAEFIPISPQMPTGPRRYLTEDFPISGSPLKEVSPMDDIQVPSQSEFDEEVCRRPREVENEGKENGEHAQRSDYTDFMADRQKMSGLPRNLDDSEVSSTKAEFGDESASFLTASEFHTTGISAVDESFSSTDRDYDIAKDPMAMSFTPGDFEAAFDRGVDLNAVHDLSTVDLDDKNGTIGEEEEEEEEALSLEGLRVKTADLLGSEQPETERSPTRKEQPTADLLGMESPEPEETEQTIVEQADRDETKLSQDDIIYLNQEEEDEESLDLLRNPLPPFEPPPSSMHEFYSGLKKEQVDETKPVDEASEEAAAVLPATDSQEEICPREASTPTILSSVPDTMERESPCTEDQLVSSVQDMHISSVQDTCVSSSPQPLNLHADVPEFVPGQHSYGEQLPDTCVTRAKSPLDDLEPKRTEEAAVEPVEEPSTESAMLEEVKKNLLDFQADGEEVCRKSPMEKSEVEVTPPPTPQETYEKISQDINALAACPESTTKDEPRDRSPEPEERFAKTAADLCQLETRKEEPFEKVHEPEATRATASALNLSESMQEFTGLEKQLQPEETATTETTRVEHEPETVMEEPVQDTMEHQPVVEEPVLQATVKPVVESVQPVTEKIEEVPEVKTDVKEEEAPEMAIEAKEPEVEKPIEAPAGTTPAEPAIEAAVEATAETSLEPSIVQAPTETVTEAPVETAVPVAAASAALVEPLTEAPVEPASLAAKLPVEAPAETPLEASEKKTESSAPTAAAVPVAAAATVAVAGAAAAAVKAKASTTKAAAKPSKPAATRTTTKSTPTSPSKAATTKPTSTTTTKRPVTGSTTSRPKELDTKRSAVSSTTGKTAAAKPATAAAAPRVPLAAKTAAKPGLSAASKPKPAAAASPKASTADKKPTANGDVKPLSKPATARPAAKPATTAAAAATAAKSSLSKPTRPSTGTTTSTKPRPTSASTTAAGRTTARSSTTAAATTRPKTAPASGSGSSATAARSRTTTSTGTASSKSPMIDKQIKETANKQISARTSASTKTTTRTSTTATANSTATTVKRASTTRTLTSSPTKKAPPTSKTTTTTTKSVTGTKITAITGKAKVVVQNGISESMQISSTIIETTKTKIEDDVPKKDLSPVVAPTDNQFIMGSD